MTTSCDRRRRPSAAGLDDTEIAGHVVPPVDRSLLQTAVSSGFEREEIADPVEVALSAMTALVTLQRDGYALIPW